MKRIKINKSNTKKKKGFTLIELLAIIVILAIIMVVTIPTVLSSVEEARKKNFYNSANVVAEWLEKQYGLARFGDGSASSAFTNICGANGNGCYDTSGLTDSALKEAGVDSENYNLVARQFKFNTEGRVCVVLEPSETGEFKSLITTDDHGTIIREIAESQGCEIISVP